ncbi:MAG: ABC transporter permease [Acidobacteriota bacterium]
MLREALQGFRSLGRTGPFYWLLILLVALGFGPVLAAFAVVNHLVLGSVNLPQADRLMVVSENLPAYGEELWLPSGAYLRLAEMHGAFEAVAAFMTADVTLVDDERPERVRLARVTPSFFEVAQVAAQRGRVFEGGDDRLMAAQSGIVADNDLLLLSDRLWRSRFAAAEDVLGQRVELDGREYQVVGILPQGFGFPEDADLWSPLGFGGLARDDWGGFFLQVVARLPQDGSLEAARARLDGLSEIVQEASPQFNAGVSFHVESLRESLVGDRDQPLTLVLLLALVILAGALVNATQLLGVRAAARRSEVAVRSALGASRGSLFRLFWVEGLLVVLPGLFAGGLIAALCVHLFNTHAPLAEYGFPTISLQWSVVAVAALLSLASVALLASLPAMLSTERGAVERLAGGDERLAGSRRSRFLQRSLIALQVFFSLSLVTTAALFASSFHSVRQTDVGFPVANLMTVDLSLPSHAGYRPQVVKNFVNAAIERLGALPGVESVAECLRLPVLDTEGGIWFRLPGEQPGSGEAELAATFNAVTAGYFETLGLPLMEGRGIAAMDQEGGEPVVVIDSLLAERHFGSSSPVGQMLILTAWPNQPRRIVGVVDSVPQGGLRTERLPAVYVPFEQIYLPTVRFLVRTESEQGGVENSVKETLWGMDPHLAFDEVAFLSQRVDRLFVPERWAALLTLVLGLLGLVLSASCVYATTSYMVRQRRRELGVRLALGAAPKAIVRHVMRSDLGAVIVGLTLGGAFCWFLARFWESLLYEVDPLDPILLGGAALVLAATVLGGMFVPARRAAVLDPRSALN